MLQNPQWDKPKTKPLTIEAVIAWLEKQPANKSYNYGDYRTCLAAQYNQSIGREYMREWRGFDAQLEEIAAGYYNADEHGPRTMGAALKRAREAVMA